MDSFIPANPVQSVYISAVGDICHPALNSPIVSLHYLFIILRLFFQLCLNTRAREILFCARALFINVIDVCI